MDKPSFAGAHEGYEHLKRRYRLLSLSSLNLSFMIIGSEKVWQKSNNAKPLGCEISEKPV